MRSVLNLLAVTLTLLGTAQPLAAQSYPSGAITLVIPLSPGDGADVAGRTMAEELAKLLKVPVVPVNRPGAGMAIGTDSVVKAKKDGQTILLIQGGTGGYGYGVRLPLADFAPGVYAVQLEGRAQGVNATTGRDVLIRVR